MRIEPTTDFAALQSLAQTIWREYYPAIIGAAQVEYMLAKMYAPAVLAEDARRGVHFARIEDETVPGTVFGFLGCEVSGEVCKLHKLYVLASARGRGVGQRALAYVEAYAREHGATRVRLNVNKHNITAQRAYERGGYTRARSEVIDIGGGYVMDDFVYEKLLQ